MTKFRPRNLPDSESRELPVVFETLEIPTRHVNP